MLLLLCMIGPWPYQGQGVIKEMPSRPEAHQSLQKIKPFLDVPERASHAIESARLGAISHGGETSSRVLFLPDFCRSPGISGVFSRAA